MKPVRKPGTGVERAFAMLSEAEPGAVLTYEDMERVLGVPVRPLLSTGRQSLIEAAGRLAHDCGRTICGVRGVGYRVVEIGKEEGR